MTKQVFKAALLNPLKIFLLASHLIAFSAFANSPNIIEIRRPIPDKNVSYKIEINLKNRNLDQISLVDENNKETLLQRGQIISLSLHENDLSPVPLTEIKSKLSNIIKDWTKLNKRTYGILTTKTLGTSKDFILADGTIYEQPLNTDFKYEEALVTPDFFVIPRTASSTEAVRIVVDVYGRKSGRSFRWFQNPPESGLPRLVKDRIIFGKSQLSAQNFNAVYDTANSFKDPHPQFQISVNRLEHDQEEIQRIQETLQTHLIGQEEVIRAEGNFQRLNRYAGVDGPLTLMGPPGLGKDTFVNALAAAIHNDPEAPSWAVLPLKAPPREGGNNILFGPPSGYMGADNLSALVRWAVLFSGGKYKIVKEGKSEKVELNYAWKKGQVLEGYYPPETGILFLNEFHDWTLQDKNLLKEIFEAKKFQINNSNGGLTHIEVPIRIVIATNEGQELLLSRDSNGNRVGDPLPYETLLEKWKKYFNDPQALGDVLMRSHRTVGDKEYGYSEEMRSRMKAGKLLLLKPPSPETIRKIALLQIESLKKAAIENGKLKKFMEKLSYDPSVIDFVATYDWIPEDGNRKIKSTLIDFNATLIKTLIKNLPLLDENQPTQVGVIKNPDQTFSVRVQHNGQTLNTLIEATTIQRPTPLMSEAEIDHLFTIEDRLKSRIAGNEEIIDTVAKRIRVRINQTRGKSFTSASALVFGFFGLSSTGKTELAKAISQEVYQTSDLCLLQLNQSSSKYQLERMLFGYKEGDKVVKSKLMNYFDRTGGKFVLLLDESSNLGKIDPEMLVVLYDLLRESKVKTFADNISRDMSNVIVVMTGNIGEEWYRTVPTAIPFLQQWAAWENIYRAAIKSIGHLRSTLRAVFTDGLINRIGEENIFFFGPLKPTAVKQLMRIKMNQALEEFNSYRDGRISWQLNFGTEAQRTFFESSIVSSAYDLFEQGASIDRYIAQLFGEISHALLRTPHGTKINISLAKSKKTDEIEVLLTPEDSGQNPISIYIPKRKDVPWRTVSEDDRILTSYHEVGHYLASAVLMKRKYIPERISSIPGIAMIDGLPILYEGVAESKNIETLALTETAVIYQIAGLLAGGVTQEIASAHQMYDAGIANDMDRATALARAAIIRYGVNPRWKNGTVQSSQLESDFILRLSEEAKIQLESEIQKYLNQGKILAQWIVKAHFKGIVIPLASQLAEKAELKAKDLRAFEAAHKAQFITLDTPDFYLILKNRAEAFDASMIYPLSPPLPELDLVGQRDAKLHPDIPRPKKIADPHQTLQRRFLKSSGIRPLKPVGK